MKTPNIKLLKNEQYINHIDFWHSIIKIQYISNHLKPKNFKECKLGHSWINESKSPIYSTVNSDSFFFFLIPFFLQIVFRYCNFKHNIKGGSFGGPIAKYLPDLFTSKIICAGSEVWFHLNYLSWHWVFSSNYYNKVESLVIPHFFHHN